MNFSKIIIGSLICLWVVSCKQKEQSSLQVPKENDFLVAIDSTLQLAVEQYSYLSQQVEPGVYPRTFQNDSLVTSDSGWWCSGFYPGTLLYLDEAINAPKLKEEAISFMADLKREQYNKSTHDLGFMMYCSFGNANRLQPNPEYQDILLNSAKSLVTRYNDTVQAIRSWDSAPWNRAGEDDLVVIIDNMMNLEMLFWATEYTQDSTYYDIAVKHADKTLRNHFREDYSSYHEVIYDEATGDVKAQITRQGASDSSAWARGQAWGVYGYVVMYRFTQDPKYLNQAQQIAEFILTHSNLPDDQIPYWDYDAPKIPNTYRDSSAAAIMASAFLELSTFSDEGKSETYYQSAERILKNLMTPHYLAQKGENGGFLLKHGVGDLPNNSEIDVPLTYGDYYFVEAMIRYKELNTNRRNNS
ncbi:glycoside hydrolase family 88 protein [Mangrovimonas sp. AS39]|uniref:glycoside hydrolase family 47 protein n=1 Tax=Mangrovimonas futianensis TaxID=2895523 RepID=UPI001E2AEAEA|nr:glycoside hydrolase family 47 protein [Mangrovimonas futianensis]MCF1190894.1 glycoside hydrolase family 88 protein [Mangrovimonas futianensis]MCF1194590.1 glycoside hydrolase family 88 protein [Mangrovimonas futianensis]